MSVASAEADSHAGDIRAEDIRPGEVTTTLPKAGNESIYFIGRISTPWRTRKDCPKRGDPVDGPLCTIAIDEPWRAALAGIERHERIQILYWMHQARRDLVLQNPKSEGALDGTFALRSPMRPNPIASSLVSLFQRSGNVLIVRGLDCLDGTPVIDIKPEHCPHSG